MQRYALVLVVASLFALPVQGTVTLVSSIRGEQIGALVGTAPMPSDWGTSDFFHAVDRTDTGLVQQNLYDVLSSPQYGTVSAMTSQVSSLSLAPNNQLTGASFAGTAAVTAATFDPYGSHLRATSTVSLLFEVTGTPVDYNLAVAFFPLGEPYGASITLWNVDASKVVTALDSGTATANGQNLAGTLQPGLYRLDSMVGYDAIAYGPVAFASSMTYNFALTPEPVSLALLALGGLAVLRRRRPRTLSQTRTPGSDVGELFEVGGHAI